MTKPGFCVINSRSSARILEERRTFTIRANKLENQTAITPYPTGGRMDKKTLEFLVNSVGEVFETDARQKITSIVNAVLRKVNEEDLKGLEGVTKFLSGLQDSVIGEFVDWSDIAHVFGAMIEFGVEKIPGIKEETAFVLGRTLSHLASAVGEGVADSEMMEEAHQKAQEDLLHIKGLPGVHPVLYRNGHKVVSQKGIPTSLCKKCEWALENNDDPDFKYVPPEEAHHYSGICDECHNGLFRKESSEGGNNDAVNNGKDEDTQDGEPDNWPAVRGAIMRTLPRVTGQNPDFNPYPEDPEHRDPIAIQRIINMDRDGSAKPQDLKYLADTLEPRIISADEDPERVGELYEVDFDWVIRSLKYSNPPKEEPAVDALKDTVFKRLTDTAKNFLSDEESDTDRSMNPLWLFGPMLGIILLSVLIGLTSDMTWWIPTTFLVLDVAIAGLGLWKFMQVIIKHEVHEGFAYFIPILLAGACYITGIFLPWMVWSIAALIIGAILLTVFIHPFSWMASLFDDITNLIDEDTFTDEMRDGIRTATAHILISILFLGGLVAIQGDISSVYAEQLMLRIFVVGLALAGAGATSLVRVSENETPLIGGIYRRRSKMVSRLSFSLIGAIGLVATYQNRIPESWKQSMLDTSTNVSGTLQGNPWVIYTIVAIVLVTGAIAMFYKKHRKKSLVAGGVLIALLIWSTYTYEQHKKDIDHNADSAASWLSWGNDENNSDSTGKRGKPASSSISDLRKSKRMSEQQALRPKKRRVETPEPEQAQGSAEAPKHKTLKERLCDKDEFQQDAWAKKKLNCPN